jgi:hypothetical protein
LDINRDSKRLFTRPSPFATLKIRAGGTQVPFAQGPLQGAGVNGMDDGQSFDAAMEKAEADLGTPNLPVPLGQRPDRPSLVRLSPTASFVSQLIAEKHNLQSQRAKRRNTVDGAVDAYATSAAKTVVRMPTGYRKTVIV